MFKSQTLLATLLLSTTLLSANAIACGNGSFKGNFDGLRPVLAKEANLACEHNGEFQRVSLEVYAIYRCLGSPVVARLKFADGKSVEAIESETNESQVRLYAADKSQINCRIESLSPQEQEALRIKKENEAKAKELRELERKKETEETIAQISQTTLHEFSNALFLKLADESDYVLVSYIFTEAYANSKASQTVRFTAKVRKTGSEKFEEVYGSARFVDGKLLRLSVF